MATTCKCGTPTDYNNLSCSACIAKQEGWFWMEHPDRFNPTRINEAHRELVSLNNLIDTYGHRPHRDKQVANIMHIIDSMEIAIAGLQPDYSMEERAHEAGLAIAASLGVGINFDECEPF